MTYSNSLTFSINPIKAAVVDTVGGDSLVVGIKSHGSFRSTPATINL